jgi:hypothetical protein
VHFSPGDQITATMMGEAFFTLMGHVQDSSAWLLHPQSAAQALKMHEINGEAPILGLNAPYRDQTYQPLTRAVGFGVLRFIPVAELASAELGSEVIVVIDDVPNDIEMVGGLITEAFQTPLAHVNVLSQARNTPNAALRNARNDPRLRDYFDHLVRLEVTPTDLIVRSATAEEVRKALEDRQSSGPALAPRLDSSVRGVQPLENHDLSSIPLIGAKADKLREIFSRHKMHVEFRYAGRQHIPSLKSR